MRLARLTAALAVAAAALAAPALAQQHPRVPLIPDAREMANPDLMGVWVVDQAASKPSAAPGVTQLRTFQFTADGKILVSFITARPDGTQSFGHWSLQVDGSPGYEYRSDNASIPIAEIRLTKADERTYNLTNSVGGHVESRATYTLSEDGQTLTLTRNPGPSPTAVIVYRKFKG